MKKMAKESIEYFAMSGEIIGAVAVVISVIYLAMQVGDSNTEMRSQTHYNALMLAQRPMEMLIQNPELGSLLTKGSGDANSLSSTEWDRLSHYIFLLFNAWEYTFLLNESGHVSPELWQGHNGYMESYISIHPISERFWTEFQTSFSDVFRSYVDGRLAVLNSQVTR